VFVYEGGVSRQRGEVLVFEAPAMPRGCMRPRTLTGSPRALERPAEEAANSGSRPPHGYGEAGVGVIRRGARASLRPERGRAESLSRKD